MTDNARRTPRLIGIYRFMFWVTAVTAIYHLAQFFYVGFRTGSFAFEWSLWRSLFYAVMCAGLANYCRNCIRNAAGRRPGEPA